MTQTDVLIIGGGFAGVSAAQALKKSGIETTLVDMKDYFEVTFATLRDIAAPEKTRNKARKHYADFLEGQFVQGRVETLTHNKAILSDGLEIQFNEVIIASGTRYPTLPIAKTATSLDINSRNTELLNAHTSLSTAKKIMVIGGGIVGVELAGEIAFAQPESKVVLAHNTGELLTGFKEKSQRKALEQLTSLGVEVEFNRYYQEVEGQYKDKNTGIISDADLVFVATGVLPNNRYLQPHFAAILNEHGYVKVNGNLEVEGQQNLYALGDIADVGEAKLGYLAQEQGTFIAKLIHKKRMNKTTKPYKRNPLMVLIPVGQKQGVAQHPYGVTTLNLLVGMKQKDLFISKVYKAFGTQPNAA